MKKLLINNSLILMEAAIVEQLRRNYNIKLHQSLVNAPLIYDETGRKALNKIYQDYINIAVEEKIPFLMRTPTWRANQSRVMDSNVNHSINIDAVRFMQDLRDSQLTGMDNIKIGGLIGCKNDCYNPNEGLSASEAVWFHAWQIDQHCLMFILSCM